MEPTTTSSTKAAWDPWLIPIQNYLIGQLLSDPEIDEVLSFVSATGTTRNCPFLLDTERVQIQPMIPPENQPTSERVRRSMIDAVPDGLE
jgi:hypothetical protein